MSAKDYTNMPSLSKPKAAFTYSVRENTSTAEWKKWGRKSTSHQKKILRGFQSTLRNSIDNWRNGRNGDATLNRRFQRLYEVSKAAVVLQLEAWSQEMYEYALFSNSKHRDEITTHEGILVQRNRRNADVGEGGSTRLFKAPMLLQPAASRIVRAIISSSLNSKLEFRVKTHESIQVQ
ncbi:hypothetical protein BJ508DRAFT_309995 [Ascobolus immersus RN42]|uniref:Uncharacterized protein n=1 Tax=Ascobolus immersus RN42 TaxID=1160509 RepID=A0A3N4I0B8_ASCIM|nr:hypothetical protein BJ508DRAFT_309995 [Ascobolus immersus RN42]